MFFEKLNHRPLFLRKVALSRKRKRKRRREAATPVGGDLLFTPFLPLRSFLYCSLSLVIRPGSTSQASETGPCSPFSTQDSRATPRSAAASHSNSKNSQQPPLSGVFVLFCFFAQVEQKRCKHVLQVNINKVTSCCHMLF